MEPQQTILRDSLSFRAWRAAPRVMPAPHSHTDVELNLPLDATLRYFFGGRFWELPPGRLAVFWGGIPHRLTGVEPDGALYLCMTIPLGWFLSWDLDRALVERLLGGEVLTADDPLDAPTFGRWAVDLDRDAPDPLATQRIALLEVEARLRRLALSLGEAPSGPAGGSGAGAAAQAERIAAHLGRHYRDPELSAASVAEAVGLHTNYALTVFREGCGMTLWDYLTRLRVSHARRLLLTTGWTAERVALESGFGSVSRFFAVFKEHCGCTPRQYRRQGGG